MSEVDSSAQPEARARLILPYALWPHSQLAALDASLLSALPFVQHTLVGGACTSRRDTGDVSRPSLSMPHEHAQAAQLGWPVVDGLLPWAAQAALQAGLSHEGDGSAWGFITLCHWQISHGLVTLTDPTDLEMDAATDAALFASMQPFFAEDGLALHRHLPGVWLVQSPDLAALPTASIERVIGDDVDAWLVGGEMTATSQLTKTAPNAPSAQTAKWQRLQNEMQMLLYTHAVNAGRRVPVNSFWLHGTGALTAAHAVRAQRQSESAADATPEWQAACDALRRAHQMAHPQAWAQAWQRVDALLMKMDADEWVLCGAHAMHTYQRQAPASGWPRLKRTVSNWLSGQPRSDWRTVLTEPEHTHVPGARP